MNMVDLAKWNPTAAAVWYVKDKARRMADMSTASGGMASAQPHFKGIFPEANAVVDDDVNTVASNIFYF